MTIDRSSTLYPGLIVLLLCAASPLSYAADEFEDSVPVDIVQQFLGMIPTGGSARLYRDVMDGFPDFSPPDNVEILASLDQGYLQRVLMQSSGDVDAALTDLREQFLARGWVANTPVPQYRLQRGFVTEGALTIPDTLCHPEYGNLQLNASGDMLNLILSVQTASRGTIDCNRNNAQAAGFDQGIMQYMPRLEVPAEEAMRLPGLAIGGGSSNNREAESRGSLQDERSIEEVFAYFQEQVESQDWIPDMQSIGSVVAIGAWRRSVDGIDLVGVLTVTSLSDDNYDLRFRMVRQQGGSSQGDAFFRAAPAQ